MKLNRIPMRPWLLVVLLALAPLSSAEWKEKVLYSFQGGNDGSFPGGGVVFDQQGNLYGVTQAGGPPSCAPIGNYCGTVYELSPSAKGGPWIKTLLYMFKGKRYNDGESPDGLIIDQAGNLYGVTAYGGTGGCALVGVPGGCGTVYELSPPQSKGGQWTYTVLYNFKNGKDGYLPGGNLVFDGTGNLYGTTSFGGGKGTTCNPDYQYCGTIFELSPPKTKGGKWTEKVLHSFKGVAPGEQFGDGANPNGGLVFDSKGAIYGTTYFGGNNVKGECEGGSGGTGCGIVFALQPPTTKRGAWTEKLLYRFNGRDGSNPAAGVVFDADGRLYGTTSAGGSHEGGLVFQLAAPENGGTWTEAIIHTFIVNGQGGCCVVAGLLPDAKGDFYGTALSGDPYRGLVFRLKAPAIGNSWTFTDLYNLTGSPDGNHPTAGLIFDGRGNLYSTAEWGGTGQSCQGGCGAVYEVSP